MTMKNHSGNINLPERLKGFRGIDLNLFIIFAAIYELGSITSAAQALGLTQPAVSHALSRLRGSLNDELFIRHGISVVPSPFAKSIIQDVFNALDTFREGPLGSHTFNPANSETQFNIALGVSMEIFLLPSLLETLSEIAPNVSINIIRIDRKEDVSVALSRGNINMAIDYILPPDLSIRSHKIGSDKLVTVVRKNNPLAKARLTKQNYLAAKHVLVRVRSGDGGIEDYQLAQLGEKRNIVAQCSALTTALRTVSLTDYMVTLGRYQLKSMAIEEDFAVFDFPFSTQKIEAFLLWHDSTELDPSSAWLRGVILEKFKQAAFDLEV